MRYTKHLLSIVFVIYHFAATAQLKNKVNYIGNYTYGINIDKESDTLSGMAFFTQDSFAIIYQVRIDSDYLYPLYRGTWQITDDTVAELKYDNGTRAMGSFENTDQLTYFYLGGSTFSQPYNK